MWTCNGCGAKQPIGHKYCVRCGAIMGAARSSPKAVLYAAKARRWVEEAERCHREGKLREAASACQEALAVDHTNTAAHALLGILYEREGNIDLAVREYRYALAEEEAPVEPVAAAPAPPPALPQRRCRAVVVGAFWLAVSALVTAIYFVCAHWPATQAR